MYESVRQSIVDAIDNLLKSIEQDEEGMSEEEELYIIHTVADFQRNQ